MLYSDVNMMKKTEHFFIMSGSEGNRINGGGGGDGARMGYWFVCKYF